MKKYKFLFGILVGILISSVSVYAATTYLASDIKYKDTTVENALNELYNQKKSSCDSSIIGTEWNFRYSGEEDIFVAPCKGNYKLETWGAQGGNYNSTYYGGYGAYAVGSIELKQSNKLYINVGGQGSTTSTAANQLAIGGYNGGGNGFNKPSAGVFSSSGGGSTHIATMSGLLKNLENKKDSILIASGGGGGVVTCPGNSTCYNAFHTNNIGHAGGFKGVFSDAIFNYAVDFKSSGGEQKGIGESGSNKASFGQGASVTTSDDGTPGGGGGFYGGNSSFFSAGGGSSYIGNPLLKEKSMYCYNCEESSEESIKTIKTTNVSSEPLSKYAKTGNGYAKITLISLN